MNEEIVVTGFALECARSTKVSRHGEPAIMQNFYFDFEKARSDEIDAEAFLAKIDTLHIISFARIPEIKLGMKLKLFGKFSQDWWMTRDGSRALKIQDFIAHKIMETDNDI
jgi:hypothetical protein